jgi:hypothetical protein
MTNSLGMRFVRIPPGEFDMGTTEAELATLWEQARAPNRPRGACTTCTATSGNGVKIGGVWFTTPRRRWTILRVRQ